MTWFAVYQKATGKLLSTGTVTASDAVLADKGLAKKQHAFNPQVPTKQWNEATRDYDDVVPPLPRLTAQEFQDLFAPAEREDLFEAARSGAPAVQKKLAAFFEYIQMAERIDREDSYITASVNAMETAGLIGSGRAGEILGG